MIARLSDDLILELERAGNEPLRVENPRNHKLYVIIAEDRLPNGDQDAAPSGGHGEWTEANNARRFVLVDKQIEGTISTDEAVELQHLQQQLQLDEYLRPLLHSLFPPLGNCTSSCASPWKAPPRPDA